MTISPDRKIWRIAGPAMASNISAASVGMVDSWAVGHLDNPLDLAGLALAAIIMALLLWSLGFLRMGTTGMVAQDCGARMRGRLYRTLMRALVLAVALGGFVLLIAWPLSDLILSFMA
ncbi:MAG: MATE family efflux transporter, partial [Sphingomonadales bacterium]